MFSLNVGVFVYVTDYSCVCVSVFVCRRGRGGESGVSLSVYSHLCVHNICQRKKRLLYILSSGDGVVWQSWKARSANECEISKGCEMLTDLMVFRH